MAMTPHLFHLSPDHVSGLDVLADRLGLGSRAAVVRRLIEDALADRPDGLPSRAQVAELVRRLQAQELVARHGDSPRAISEGTGTPLRTVQRWRQQQGAGA